MRAVLPSDAARLIAQPVVDQGLAAIEMLDVALVDVGEPDRRRERRRRWARRDELQRAHGDLPRAKARSAAFGLVGALITVS